MFVLKTLTDLYFLDLSRKPTFLLLSRPFQSLLHAKQAESAPVHHELCEIHSFHKDAKRADQQNKFQNCTKKKKSFQQCSFVLSSRYRAHVNQMSEMEVARQLHPI